MCKTLKLNPFNTSMSPVGAIASLLLLAMLLYANTFKHDYALDDSIVIKENMFTKQGISGLSGIFTKDTFYGFFKKEGKDNLVAGGRYRPMSLAFFAVGWSIWGNNPTLFHISNVLFYGLCCFLIYLILSRLKLTKDIMNGWFPYLVAVVFLVHPIHTEVVANIKGLDEIFSLSGSLLACFLVLKSINQHAVKYQIAAMFAFFFALMSKENAITFVAVIPLTLILLNNNKLWQAIKYSWPLWVATIIFLIIRTSILGFDFGDAPKELMNNPFLKIEGNMFVPFSFSEKMANIFFCLGQYLKLFIVPYPLTHDYYPYFVELKSFSDLFVVFSVIIHLALGVFAVLNFKKHPIFSYCIAFYLITLSIVSNVVFPVGTNMAERFVFMPSLGISILMVYTIHKFMSDRQAKIVASCILITIFSGITIGRNPVWKNDLTLFTTDVKTSHNSAKANNAAGGALQAEARNEKDEAKKKKMLKQSVDYLKKAIELHPNYKNAYLLLGNSYFYLENYRSAIKIYEGALRIDPQYQDALNNLSVSYRELGKMEGEQNNNIGNAINYLSKSFQLNDTDPETVRLLGVAHGIANDHGSAIRYFEQLTTMIPDSALAYVILFKAYKNAGFDDQAENAYKKAIRLDPDAFKK